MEPCSWRRVVGFASRSTAGFCAIPHCEALAYSALECLDDPSWVKWSTTFGAIERRAIDCKTDVRTVRCQWQAFARVLQATRLALKLIRSEDLQAELVMTRTQFIDQFVLEGEIASSSFKALANMSLDASLSGSSDAEDHGLISRLGRAVETDPRIILSKEELSRSNAASLYADRPQEAFMKLVDDHGISSGSNRPFWTLWPRGSQASLGHLPPFSPISRASQGEGQPWREWPLREEFSVVW